MNAVVNNCGKKVMSLFGKLAPKTNTKLLFLIRTHKWPNLKQPRTFNEKTTWLKINNYNSNELVAKCADKYAVRDYVKNKGCGEILNKCYGVYDSFDEIDFEKMPNQFVIKCVHGCAYNIIVKDKSKFNKNNARKKVLKWQKEKYGYATTELHYTRIKPRIIIEKYLCDKNGKMPMDYKFYCMNGRAIGCMVCSDRIQGTHDFHINFFDNDWKELPYFKKELRNSQKIEKPKNLEQMIEYANKLSEGFPFVRVDLYNDNGKIIFGEMTFTPACYCNSKIGDTELGAMLKLNNCLGNRKKILVVVPSLSVRSGVASHIMNYYNYIRTDFQIDFATYNLIENKNTKIIKENRGKIFYFQKNFLKSTKAIKSFFKEHANEYSIIHCHTFNYGLPYLFYAKKYGINNRILHAHSVILSDDTIKRALNTILTILCTKISNIYVACSEVAGEKNFRNKPYTIINNCIDLSQYGSMKARASIRAMLKLKDNEFLFGNVGKLSKTKNQLFALRVFNELKNTKKFKNSKIMIIGSGPLLEKIKAYAKNNNLEDSLIMLSNIPNTNDYYMGMDCFIFPSLGEGLGIALIEAQASGLPCFCSDALPKEAFASELVNKLKLKDDATTWCNAILQSNLSRKNVKKQLQQAGFDVRTESIKLKEFYRNLIEQGSNK